MESSELEEIFDDCGWSTIYEKHQYKFWLTGIAETIQEDVLLAFLDVHSCEDAESQCFDELLYQLRVFKYVYERNDFILYPR